MLNLPKLREFIGQLVNKSPDIIQNAFLVNGENEIIVMAKGEKQEAMILGNLLAESLYIIRTTINEQEEEKEQQKLQIIADINESYAFLFSFESHFILGVLVGKESIEKGHKIATDAAKVMKRELKNVIEWIQKQT